MRRSVRSLRLAALVFLFACSGTEKEPAASKPCGGATFAFEPGDAKGHSDPFGAKAAGQARAGRVDNVDAAWQPAHGRQKINAGDFVLANDSIAVFIEDKGLSDGYARFGGEILAIDAVGDDGRPKGLSRYGETLTGLSIDMIDPTSVTVLKDGSDGGEAVVRVIGKLTKIPFMDGPLSYLFPRSYEQQAAYDYVLKPGEPRVTMRVGVVNETNEPIDFAVDSDELFGFFQSSNSKLVTQEFGYAEPEGQVEWAGWEAGPLSFALRTTNGPLAYGLTLSGFALFYGPGFIAEACSATMNDRAELIAGGPEYDGLREAVRKTLGEPAWREVSGHVTDALGAPVAEAYLHVLAANGAYLSRTRTAADGSFVVHVPPDAPVSLVPQKRGYVTHPGFGLMANEAAAEIVMDPDGKAHIVAKDPNGTPIPVRIQIIPQDLPSETPPAFGVPDEVNGRLHQAFAMNGEATLVAPPGPARVIVSRGYEWELFEQEITVLPGQTIEVPVTLTHSVNTDGVMCGDFHIHSRMSADSDDSIEEKVKSAIADGLDIPVSSEHEWVIDFQPVIEKLGASDWAFGMPSEELTTFTWGHFGVVPLLPQESKLNNGAVDWIGKDPAEVFAIVQALPENPVLIVNHPSGGLGFGAYFNAAGYDAATGTGKDGFWSDNFDAIEVFNSSDLESNREQSVADWFSLLEHGMKVWAVGSSDSHHLRTSPVGYPRTCMRFGHDNPKSLTREDVRDALAKGASTISGGLYMTVSGPNGQGPGETVATGGGEATFTITVEAPSYIQANTLETILNGKTLGTEPLAPIGAGPGKKFANQVKVKLDPQAPRNWLVFHAKGEGDLAPLHPGKHPFAVSNPIFLE